MRDAEMGELNATRKNLNVPCAYSRAMVGLPHRGPPCVETRLEATCVSWSLASAGVPTRPARVRAPQPQECKPSGIRMTNGITGTPY